MPDPRSPLLLRVAGREVEVWTRISPRALRVRLTVRPGPRVELTLPEGTGRESAAAFLQEQIGWLERALGKARTVQASLADHLRRFPSLTYDERWLSVELREGARAGHRLASATDSVLLMHRADDVEGSLARAVRSLARESLPAATRRLAQRVRIRVGDISVRDQSSRWGSCSATGALSLNWRLVLLPPAMHDHVILHELAHRVHMDHSERFWGQLADWDPDWQRHDRELTRRWNILMDLGRA